MGKSTISTGPFSIAPDVILPGDTREASLLPGTAEELAFQTWGISWKLQPENGDST